MSEAIGTPAGGWTGQPLKRREDPAMLSGQARYVGDLVAPGTLEVAFVRSTYPHATITGIDVTAALAAPGVTAVYTAADLGGTTPLVDLLQDNPVKTPRPALATDRVRYVGEPVAAVVATDRYLAEDAAELVEIGYDVLAPVAGIDAATSDGAALVHDHVEGNRWYTKSATFGDVDAGFARAERTWSKSLHIQRHLPCAMEGRGLLAQPDPVSGDLVVWISTQGPFTIRFLLSLALGLPESRIRVVAPFVGGSFGPKDFVMPEDVVVATAALRLGRPVRWTEDRVENLSAGPHAKEQEVTVEIGATADGRITAMRAELTSDTGAFAYSAVSGQIDTQLAAHALPGAYDVPAFAYRTSGVLTNKPPVAPYRGVGMTAAQTVRELLLDEIARDLGIDRVELRRRNLLTGEPTTNIVGQRYDGGTYREAVDLAVEAIGRDAGRRVPDGWLRGVGVSPYVEMAALGPRSGAEAGLVAPSFDNAEITLDLSGQFRVAVGTCSHGQGHATAFAQLAADALGVGIDEVYLVDGDTATTPWGMGTFASRSAVYASGAIDRAAAALVQKLIQLAAALMETPPEALEVRPGAVGVRGVPEAQIPLAELAGAALMGPGRAILDDPNLVGRAFYDAEATYANGCIAVEVGVDPETYEARISNIVAVEDCGTMINPRLVDGQMVGGLVQGIGAALLETYVFNDDAHPLTTTLVDYLLPLASDSPGVEIHHLSTPTASNGRGIKGMAESTSIGAPAAVLCAIADALAPQGFTIDDVPYRSSAAWRQLDGSSGSGRPDEQDRSADG